MNRNLSFSNSSKGQKISKLILWGHCHHTKARRRHKENYRPISPVRLTQKCSTKFTRMGVTKKKTKTQTENNKCFEDVGKSHGLLHALLAWMFSEEKSSVILILGIGMMIFLWLLEGFLLFVLDFLQFEYDMPQCRYFGIYSV